MHFTSFLENGKLTIALSGEIDHHCAKAYIQIIGAKIEAYMPQICVLDFQDALYGPASYDITSLLADAFFHLPLQEPDLYVRPCRLPQI